VVARIEFRRATRGESEALVHRPDGVVVWVPSFTRKHRVPHDVAHAVTERELRLAHGVFGSIMAGAVFDNMRVVSGRTRHDARAVSDRILRANARSLSTAECLAGVLHHAVEHHQRVPTAMARRAWGSLNEDPFPWSDVDITRATEALRELDEQWHGIGGDDVLTFAWPRALTAPPPAPSRVRTKRGRLPR
jgi:hypothetical protein